MTAAWKNGKDVCRKYQSSQQNRHTIWRSLLLTCTACISEKQSPRRRILSPRHPSPSICFHWPTVHSSGTGTSAPRMQHSSEHLGQPAPRKEEIITSKTSEEYQRISNSLKFVGQCGHFCDTFIFSSLDVSLGHQAHRLHRDIHQRHETPGTKWHKVAAPCRENGPMMSPYFPIEGLLVLCS